MGDAGCVQAYDEQIDGITYYRDKASLFRIPYALRFEPVTVG